MKQKVLSNNYDASNEEHSSGGHDYEQEDIVNDYDYY